MIPNKLYVPKMSEEGPYGLSEKFQVIFCQILLNLFAGFRSLFLWFTSFLKSLKSTLVETSFVKQDIWIEASEWMNFFESIIKYDSWHVEYKFHAQET